MRDASLNLLRAIAIVSVCSLANADQNPITINTPSTPPSQETGYVESSYIVTFKNTDQTKASPIIQPPDRARNLANPVPFGQHSTGQSKDELASLLGIKGQGRVIRIFETINAAHVEMDARTAARLRNDPRVERVSQDTYTTAMTTQTSPGWGLDRLDSSTAALNNSYSYTNNGAGQTIYILDSGLNMGNTSVINEFGTRATMFFDFNGGTGNDCNGHGTQVASAAGSNTYGTAKGATLRIVKITTGCTGNAPATNTIDSFNWLAANAPAGTIVNWSYGYSAPFFINQNGDPVFACGSTINQDLENSIRAAHNAGIIVVVSAGNDGCDTANYSPTRISEAFVVGATQNSLLNGSDALAEFRGAGGSGNGGTRTGSNISTFAPGRDVLMLWREDGFQITNSGTSFAAPYIAGVFAVACQAVGNTCATAGTAALYTALRSTGTLGTVVNPNGTPLTNSTSRFIRQQW